MAFYKVVEMFESINGEGMKSGELAVFVRFLGCNLRCSYCDTLWALSEDAKYDKLTEDDIYTYIKSTGIKNVTLTGGEPLIQKDIIILLNKLSSDESLNIEIETNGSIKTDNFRVNKNISFTLDYKLPGSGFFDKMNEDNFINVSKNDTVKFVVSDRNDLEKSLIIIKKYKLDKRCNTLLSPVFGKIDPVNIVEFMKENTLNNIRFQLQIHKFIWDPSKRGV